MYNFKKSIAGLIGVLGLFITFATLLPLAGRGQVSTNVAAPFAPRKFYLTQTSHRGNDVLNACAAGYHMASLWEILDPSNLRYDTHLGVTTSDSGSGPPAGPDGWIRTGGQSAEFPAYPPGQANCQSWTEEVPGAGPVVSLSQSWTPTGTTFGPWVATPRHCNMIEHVWCVQD